MSDTDLREFRKTLGLTQGEVAEEVGVHTTTVSRWERESHVPVERREALANALEVSVERLKRMLEPQETPKTSPAVEEGATADGTSYVSSEDDEARWIRAVMGSELGERPKLILAALPNFLDYEHWVVSVTEDAFCEETHITRETVDAHWDEAIASDFVERIGPAEWVLRLVFPEE